MTQNANERRMIAQRHEENAARRREEAKLVGIADPRYHALMLLVGFHTIQANLWRKSIRNLHAA